MADLYEQLQEDIVQYDTHAYQHRVAEQLYAAFQIRFREHDVFRQSKTYREADAKGDNECKYVCRYSDACNMYRLLQQQKVIADIIYQNVRYRIGSATGQVTKGGLTYYVLKGFMKKVNNTQYYMSDSF